MLTSDTALPRAEAFAVKDGRFTAVGSTGDVRNLATARTPVIDAQRMTVVPGFIDAHSHPSGVEELYGVNTNLRTVREIQSAIRAKVETTRRRSGSPASCSTTPSSIGRSRARISTRRRPSIRCRWRTAAATPPSTTARRSSSPASPRRRPIPPDGRFFRENGELNGRVAENARDVFDRVGKYETFTPEQRRDRARKGMAHMSKLFNAAGLTTVHNAGTCRSRSSRTRTAGRTAS